jgi:hypothetical protein
MSIKFYNNNTQFLDDEIIDDNNVLFDDDIKQQEENTKDLEVVTDDLEIQKEDIEFIDDEPAFNREITITKSIEKKYIEYSDDQFKNNLLLLCKNLCTKDNKINTINNLLKIYKNINNRKLLKLNDVSLVPIIEVKKKFYIYEEKLKDDIIVDAITINNNELLVQDYLENFFIKRDNIIKSVNDNFAIKESKLYELERPFDYLNENESKRVKYSPEFDRDTISSCIFENLNNYNSEDFRCVNIKNNPINLEKFRLLSEKNLTLNTKYKSINDDNTLNLYTGDNVKLIGYITKVPTNSNENVKLINLQQYYTDLDDMRENDSVSVYLNIKTDVEDNKYSGTITNITNNTITVKLNTTIKFLDKDTNVLKYDKLNNNNFFNLYPSSETNNVYYKNPLKEQIFAFIFPIEDKDIQKHINFIIPNVTELLSYYDDFLSNDDVNKLLNKFNYNINDINNNDIITIKNKIDSNINNYQKKLKQKKNNSQKKYDFKTDSLLYKFESLPDFYDEYLHKNNSIDSNTNRLIFLEKQKDNGYYHFINILKNVIDKEYDNVKSIDYDKDLENFTKEYTKLEKEISKNNNNCKQIKISKFFYDETELTNNEGNKKEYEGKYVLFTDNTNVYSILYLMTNGNWVEQFKISAEDKNSIKLCDGSYYYEKTNNDTTCIYDDIDELCKKKNDIVDKKKLDILKIQIDIAQDIKDFVENYDKYNKELLTIQKYYKNLNNYEQPIKQIEYIKTDKNKKYIGDENYINFEEIYNNFDTPNDPFYTPIILDTEEIVNTKQKDEEYLKIITKILNIIGFELQNQEINHIIKSIDFFIQVLREQTINDYKKKNKDTKISNKDILNKIYQNNVELQQGINRDIILIVISMIIIIIQIQYPNIKLVKINQKSAKYFSIRGFPIEKINDDNKNKQLYVYIGNSILTNLELKDKINLSSKIFFNKIQITVKTILKRRNYYKTLLDKNISEFGKDNKPLKIKVWTGYKPEININKEPKTLIGKYIYELFDNINDDKIYKFNAFRKPLIENICCYSQITPDLNYYDFFKGKINIKKYHNTIDSSKDNNTLKILENFFNYYKKNGIKSNFDDIHIFNEIIKFKDDVSNIDKVSKFSQEYYEYAEVFKTIIESNDKLKSDTFLLDVIDNFNVDKKWDELSKMVNELFTKLTNFLKQNSTSYDENIINKLEIYLVTLRKNNEIINNKELLVIKKILQQFITYKLSSTFYKIINNKTISDTNDSILSESLKANEELLKTIKQVNYTINVQTINLEDKNDTSINNITKNIYLLNYILLTLIYNIFSSLLNVDTSEYINIETILTRLTTFMGSTEEQDIDKKVNILSDIILYILNDIVINIENNLIDYEQLQSNMNDLREERKQKKIRYYNNLTIDDVDVLKKLKDIGHELDINYNEYNEETTEQIISDGTNPRNQEITNDDDDRDAFEIDYVGENDDELDYDNE